MHAARLPVIENETSPRLRWSVFAILIALAAVPPTLALRRAHGFDARAYFGAAVLLARGESPYTDAGFRHPAGAPESASTYLPPFLYHPALAVASRRLSEATGGDFRHFARIAGAGGALVLLIGAAGLGLALGVPPHRVGIALVLYHWNFVSPAPVTFGNLGPAMAGLILLGAAGLVRGSPLLAGCALGGASLFKPATWLVAVALAALWRPERRSDKPRLALAWFGVYLAATFVALPLAGRDSFGEYLEMFRRMGSRVWSMAASDASLGATFLRAISAWTPPYHEMTVFGLNQVAASLGWLHEDVRWMQAVNAIGLGGMAWIVLRRRRDLGAEPVAAMALATIAGFLFQPGNWPHNYGALLLAPAAIRSLATGSERAGDAEFLRASNRRLLGSAALLAGMMWPPIILCVDFGVIETRELGLDPGFRDLLLWHVARIVNCLPTLWLGGLALLVLRQAEESARSEDASGEASDAPTDADAATT